MLNKTHIMAAVLILGVGRVALPKIQCATAFENAERQQKEIDALYKLREEMLVEFEGILAKDMRSAAEGEKESGHRSTAVKLAFAKNRLNKKIEAKEKELADFTKEFCKGCAPDKKAKDKVAQFCELCEDASRCPEDQN